MEYRGIRSTISRRKVVQGAAAAVALGAPSIQAQQDQRLRFVAHADHRLFDVAARRGVVQLVCTWREDLNLPHPTPALLVVCAPNCLILLEC